ncbi:MAG: response regulator [Microscillaceae bacterium]|nr:response regulator [Microscillaceae bacterium]MDW8461976.1 response regulator [Cytophagales bacterium]
MKQTIKTIIVDDEPMARAVLRGIIQDNFPEVEICKECKDVPEAVKAIHAYKPDVVFLDIEMPNYTGFDLIDFFEPTQINFHIIFVTAYSEYSLQAFEISAVDYLLKPIRTEQLARALKKVMQQSKQQTNLNYKVLQENLQDSSEQKIVLHTADAVYVVKFSDLIFLQADGGYTRFFTSEQGEIMISKGLSHFEALILQDKRFFKTHRSYIINTEKINRIDKKRAVVIMSNQQETALAQEKRAELLEKLENR